MYTFFVQLRSAILVFLTHKMALPILRIIRKPEKFPYTREELHLFTDGSLGKELIIFLDRKGLGLLAYYARHDIKHILLEYDTTDEGEACLQCFMLGNGHVSFPVVATVLYGICTMPEYWSVFKKAYAKGKKCPPISGWKWFEILNQPTALLKQKISCNANKLLTSDGSLPF